MKSKGPFMHDTRKQVSYWIVQHLQQRLTEQEADALNAWMAESPNNRQLFEKLTQEEYVQQEIARFNTIDSEGAKQEALQLIFPNRVIRKKRHIPWFWYAAAAVLLVMGTGVYRFILPGGNNNKTVVVTPAPAVGNKEVAPGGNKAVLTLADNSTIALDEAQNGPLSQQDGTSVTKEDGLLKYEAGGQQPEKSSQQLAIKYNLLSTPKGGQYKLVLPDGSKVWLNAGSSIRFPTVFTEKERKVAITGEVYFEVKTLFTARKGGNVKVPFIVSILPQHGGPGGTVVEVLGTHFNVNAYADEDAIKTTLLEGKVRVKTTTNHKLLAPGEQAQTTGNENIVINSNPDLEGVMAWKNGQFHFNKADFKTVMRQLARWYDVEVVYVGASQPQTFSGSMQRNLPLSTVLKYLERAHIQVRMEGRTLQVLP